MRHYEVVFLVNPNQKEKIPTTVEKISKVIEQDGGKTHRLEEWGRKILAYPIQNHKHAFYVLMNIECSLEALREIEKLFRFNDSVMRNLVIKKDKAETGESFMLIEQRKENTPEKPKTAPRAAPRAVAAPQESSESSESPAPAEKVAEESKGE